MAKKKLDKKNKEKTEPKQGTKLWGGRFSEATDRLTEELNASIGFDIRLLSHDIKGSVAHASGLERAGILTPKEREKIEKGLKSVEEDILSGRFVPTIADEDIHMAVEGRLTSKIGSLGGKLHTARSRNDQVALDTRLFLREETTKVIKLLKELQKTLCQVSEKNIDVIMPGYTHLQRAQPILFAHHMLAYQEMIKRDRERFTETLKRIDVMPLGSGALAGSPYNIDRRYVAKLLGFKKISTNSMDAVASRDVLLEFLSNSAILMINLSRLSEELVLWNSEEFGFIELSDAFTTGSSIMPQKKNPDIAELTRGKSGRVTGNLVTLLMVMKALPLAYNKDMQEDKEPLFDSVDTIKACLQILSPMLKKMKVKKKQMRKATEEGFLMATDAADYLVASGLPFRQAHEAIGKTVAFAAKNNKNLSDLSLKEWQGFSKYFKADILEVITPEASINSRTLTGGTAFKSVKSELSKAKQELRKKP